MVDTKTLLARFAGNPLLSGVTFSGGEPFEQPGAAAELAARIHALGKTVMVYTGYTVERLHELAKKAHAVSALLEQADILVDGPYIESLRELDAGFKGSANQRILDREAVRDIRCKLG